MDITPTTTNDISQHLNDMAHKFQGAANAPQTVAKKKARNASIEAAYIDTEVIVPLDREQYVTQFRQREQATASAILDMCRTVYEAFQTLDEDDFVEFCGDVGHSAKSSTIRKFIAIGKVQPRLKGVADQLPTGWTSIYQLTQIPAKTFDIMITKGQSLATLTGKEIRELVQTTRPYDSFTDHLPTEKITYNPIFAKVCFTSSRIDGTDWLLVKNAFAALENKLPIKIMIDPIADNVFEQQKLEAYDTQKRRLAAKLSDISNLDDAALPFADNSGTSKK